MGEQFFRNRVDPCLGLGWVPEEDSSAQPLERLATWVQGGKPRIKVFTGLDAVCPKSGPYEASEGIDPGYRQGKKLGVGKQRKEGSESSPYKKFPILLNRCIIDLSFLLFSASKGAEFGSRPTL
jgi:hypothetical protein